MTSWSTRAMRTGVPSLSDNLRTAALRLCRPRVCGSLRVGRAAFFARLRFTTRQEQAFDLDLDRVKR
jgi:hypothetical protein